MIGSNLNLSDHITCSFYERGPRTCIVSHVRVVCLPETQEMNGVTTIFRSLHNWQFHHMWLELLEHFMVVLFGSWYHSGILSIKISLWTWHITIFTRSSFYVFIFIFLHVYFLMYAMLHHRHTSKEYKITISAVLHGYWVIPVTLYAKYIYMYIFIYDSSTNSSLI